MTTALIHLGQGQHVLHVPHLIGDIWRFLNFVLEAFIFGGAWVIYRWPVNIPGSRRWFMVGVMVLSARQILVSVEQWMQPLTVEATPITTIICLLWLRGMIKWQEELAQGGR